EVDLDPVVSGIVKLTIADRHMIRPVDIQQSTRSAGMACRLIIGHTREHTIHITMCQRDMIALVDIDGESTLTAFLYSEPLFRLAVFDEGGWQFDALPQDAAYREGEAIPLLLRIDNALPGATYPLTIRYACQGFNLLTTHDRDTDSEPALASGGPGSAIADSTVQIPDDPGTDDDDGEAGSLSLWGGSFIAIGALLPPSPCTDQKSLSVSLLAAADTLFLMWAAQLSESASDSDVLLRLVVQLPDGDELIIEIDPASVAPAQP
ncbi:hypothetical protein LCGC14_2767840, partial [marine sediment metagenome]